MPAGARPAVKTSSEIDFGFGTIDTQGDQAAQVQRLASVADRGKPHQVGRPERDDLHPPDGHSTISPGVYRKLLEALDEDNR